MDVPARVVSGLTPSAKALYVAAAAHAHAARRRPVRVSRPTATSSRRRRRRLLSRRRSKGCPPRRPSAPSCRSRRTKSIRTAAWRRTSASRRRARGRCMRSARGARAWSSRRRRRCCRASARRSAARRVDRAQAGQDIAPDRSRPSCSSTPASPARIRPTSTASSRSAAASSTSSRPARRSPVRLEFIGDTIESLRTYDPATQRSIAAIDQMPIVPLRDVLATIRATDVAPDSPDRDSSTTSIVGDDLRLPRARDRSRIIVSERDEVEAQRRQAARAAPAQLRGGAEPTARAVRGLPAAELFADWSVVAAAARSGDARSPQLGLDDDVGRPDSATRRTLRAPDAERPARRAASAASRRSSCTAASPTGSPRSGGCATTARRRCSSPRRRAAPSGRSSC